MSRGFVQLFNSTMVSSITQTNQQDELHAYFEDFYSDSFRLTPELDNALSDILDTKDPLDSSEFNPIESINRMFPNEQSLASLDEILQKLKQKMHQLDEHTKELTRTQSGAAGQESIQELEAAKKAIQDLFAKIRQIKEKATQSETMVQEITRDIKSLDYAKRHLTYSITALKRLQMLVTAVDQLQSMTERKQYKESAQLLQAVVQLIQYFKTYKSIPQIAQLSNSISKIQVDLNAQVFQEFQHSFSHDGALTGQAWILHDACLVADVLGDTARNRLVGWYVDLQLHDYRAVFRPNEEVSALDNVSRRYAWLKRLLKVCDEEHNNIFPPSWHTSELLCERFCEYTKKDLSDVLPKSQNSDVKVLVKALQLTIEWELQLSRRFSRTDAHHPNEADPLEPPSKFVKSISSCFEPYLGQYIDAEDKTLSEMMVTYKNKPQNSEEDASAVVLSSSTDLFYFYRETLVQCAKLSTGKPFLDLCQLFGKYLVVYANEVLIGKLPRDEKRTIALEDIRYMCLILNTADYCFITISQLEEKLKEKIDEGLQENVSLEKERETFLNTVSVCVRALVRGVQNRYDPCLNAMAKISWATMDSVGDQSPYVSNFQSCLAECVGMIGKMITNKRYFRTFCDKLVESFVVKYLNNIMRCKQISEVGAEQMLLDTHAIKTSLLELHSMGQDALGPMPTTFAKFVNRGISKAETILKVVMTPHDPAEGLIGNYLFLIADKSTLNFQKILDLKGIKKVEHPSYTEAFQQQASQQPNLPENSQIMSSITHSSVTGSSINSSTLPMSITSSLNNIASSASNFSPSQLSQLPLNLTPTSSPSGITTSSPSNDSASPSNIGLATGTRTGKFNENFRKLVMTGMSFRRDIQERRDRQEANNNS
ncbi:hypothetical protein BC936DRAFT_144204 [Jimgerdemannia flammicorona]|uniref:Uncharacterized protein n=1 Tax=Jimgerdemannia flammicorona TaxID=994334 RepID=A0A433DCW6_9FUNG|nr:hypothetical protein BC936DRAFT_144204 [Jimgerdemannia flammicorona]